MANTTSAKKAQRVALRRRVFNARRKTTMKSTVKDMGKAIAAKSGDVSAMLPKLQEAIDKAVKKGTLHKNTAARMKSRISKQIAALGK